MLTEYEVSSRLIFWGDNLDPVGIHKVFELDPSICVLRIKGDVIKEANSDRKASYAKTGMFSYRYDNQHPNSRHNPEEQFNFITNRLNLLPEKFDEMYKVEKAQLQLFIYYDATTSGEADFIVPSDLMFSLCKYNIEISITVLP